MSHRGHSFRLGATVCGGGVNLSLFSRSATRVNCCSSTGRTTRGPADDRSRSARPSDVPLLACLRAGAVAGQLYGYRVHGPFDPAQGMRFDPTKVLLDPYGRGVWSRRVTAARAARQPGDNAATAMKSVVADPSAYDWEGDAPLRRPSARTIIYEMHVRGFTRPPSSGVAEAKRGTYAGLIEKILISGTWASPAVELLPVFQFDAQDCPPGRVNYWGYAPVSFFAPHQAYSSRQDALGPLDEFRDMVRRSTGPASRSFSTSCSITPRRGRKRADGVFSWAGKPRLLHLGTGPRPLRELQRDGEHAQRQSPPRAPPDSGQPPLLGGADARGRLPVRPGLDPGAGPLGSAFVQPADPVGHSNPIRCSRGNQDHRRGVGRGGACTRWAASSGTAGKEWKRPVPGRRARFLPRPGRYGGRLADRLLGSRTSTGTSSGRRSKSVNFVACHDGFTLNDLVSYNGKRNAANGEDNRDGARTTAAGTAPSKARPAIPLSSACASRQVKNLLTATLLSLGSRCLLMGDEVRRTQRGKQQRVLSGQRTSAGSTGRNSKRTRRPPVRDALSGARVQRDVEPELTRDEPYPIAGTGEHRVARREARSTRLSHHSHQPGRHRTRIAKRG